MELNDYQKQASKTVTYPKGWASINGVIVDASIVYCALKLSGETGEVTEKIGKVMRDKEGFFGDHDRLQIAKELGDVLWYLSQLALEFGFDLEFIAQTNLDKLAARQTNNTLKGEGDNR